MENKRKVTKTLPSSDGRVDKEHRQAAGLE